MDSLIMEGLMSQFGSEIFLIWGYEETLNGP
jgi:hypothetical protein